jgi:dienelactone hydrolase
MTPPFDSPDTRRVFTRGQLSEHVASQSSPGQQFAIYVPSSYDESRPAPVIYLMDPRSRARVPANLFLPAAERYGYILISSHNTSSDGPIEPTLVAMQAMWDDVHAWFHVDDRRQYVAGFSGTARTASLLARHRPDFITGIIGAGAGFDPAAPPSENMTTLYFGTAGTVDYNFHQMELLESSMASLNVPHRLEHFEGEHSWMTPDLATQAIEWMELRAMQSGARTRDEALIDAWWARDDAVARGRIAEGRLLDAARRYGAMARDFAGLRETGVVAAEAARLTATHEAQQDARRRQAEAREAAEWNRSAMQAIANAFPRTAESPLMPAADLSHRLGLERMKKDAAAGGQAGLEAQRRLNEMEVQLGFYLPAEAIEHADLARAAYYLSLAILIDDRWPVSWYLMAEVHARLNARRPALSALRRAVDAGFRDLAALEADPAFRRLRTDPEYAGIIEPLRRFGDTLDLPQVDRPPAHMTR